ncbi:iron(III) transport system substrate-binding protein [Monaibacterium marinum]|uniref:Iron(III) transport system substrate-binding protein n=1 Tax=Pontivivens marinum TaxID=1690039 RepID=A0A2C9CVH6_9RHOB|nr:extracellular solute-binding protein [Monaibacterium marinum]SOH95125.1 iron(III) transport system substrate-binding protein [Monaibacterium marinum]
MKIRNYLAAGVFAPLLLASAAVAQDVYVLTDRGINFLSPMVRAFQEETGYSVSVRSVDGDVVDFLLDNEDSQSASVLVTASITLLDDAYRAGLTMNPQSEVLEQAVPAEFRHPDNQWFGITRRLRGLYVSSNASEWLRTLSYEDLADPRLDGRICIRSGTHNYNLGLFSAYATHYGREEAEQWLAGLKSNLSRSPQGNDRAQMRAVSEGLCSVAIANSYYYGLARSNHRQRDWAEQINLVFPRFERGGTHVNISGMAMLSTVENVDAARAFMEFQLSAQAQDLYARRNFEYPMIEGVAQNDFTSSWGEFEPDAIGQQDIADLHVWARGAVERIGFND